MSGLLRIVEEHTSPWEAHVTRGLLASEGIPAILLNEQHVAANWPISLALGGVQVCVPNGFEIHAIAVLARRNAGEYEDALSISVGLPAWACVDCGGKRFTRVTSKAHFLLALVSFGLAGVIFPPKAIIRCLSCGRRVDDL